MMGERLSDRLAEISRIGDRLGTVEPSRILAALGHPGYGDVFAASVLLRWAETGEGLHYVIGRMVR